MKSALLLAAALVVTSCSSGSKAAAPTTTPASSTTPASTTTPGGAGAGGSCRPGAGPGATAPDNVAVPGDIPDGIKFVDFTSPDGYRIRYPEAWARSEGAGHATFTDKFNSIRVQVAPAPAAPTVASAQAADVPALSTSAPCFQAGKVNLVTRNAGPAVLITYKADSPADPVTGKVVREDVERYAFWKGGKQVVITLSAPQGSDNVDPWKTVTDSFAWTA